MKNVARSRTVIVDGIRTHYWEAGEGRAVVLLHSGEFGARAEFTWERTVASLSSFYRVVAPDWLGFGETEKIVDFGAPKARMLRHMARFLDVIDIGPAAFVGSSMGGTVLLEVLSQINPSWNAEVAVVVSGGGFVPFNAARKALVGYNGDLEGMRAIVSNLFHDQSFAADDAYVARRHRASIQPGSWEATAAARLRLPGAPQRDQMYGKLDITDYEQVRVPVLLVAGAQDKLREPGYAKTIHARISGSRLKLMQGCGHMPQLERPEEFNSAVIDFLTEVYPPTTEPIRQQR